MNTNNIIMLPVGFSVNQGALFFTHDNELLNNHYTIGHFKDCRYQDLYELSDEELNEGDFGFDGTEIFRCHKWDKEHKIQNKELILANFNHEILERNRKQCKKIIASTDKYLTPDNLLTTEIILAFIEEYKASKHHITKTAI